ncbi:MAG: HAD-IA family hydrolase [Oscillospiraceae bacterium]|nr:HAD-IA family hydrolase [Oscillospiraceae bacterium]
MSAGVLLDLDGTLLDTLEDLHRSTNYALERFGYPQRTLEEVRRFVGNGAERLIRLAVPEGADPGPVLAAFREHYQAHCRERTGAYPGIPAALAALGKTYPLAIVSNKPDSAVKALCDDYFPGIYARGESDDCPRKPAPDMVWKAMAAIGVDRCVYVGDSEVDILTAKNAGVPCLSVSWGFRDKEALLEAGGAYFCEEPRDLAEKIRDILAGR